MDVVLNNATVAPLGAVQDLAIAQWDASYRVNLRGPVLLARAFLPGMVQRQHGVFVCVSSTGVAFMGAYEILKTAQVELANTLQADLEGTGVTIFTIGPGVAPTPTATAAIERLASLYGQSTAEFYVTVQDQFISVEAAGAGYVKDPAERETQLRIVRGWQEEVEHLAALLASNGSPEKPTYSYREHEEKMV